MNKQPRIALNRIMQPALSLPEFIRLASRCSAAGIEIRNDLPDPSLLGGESPDAVRSLCAETGIDVLTVNALQRFNDPALFSAKEQELAQMMEEASSVGCGMIVLCPVNDPDDDRDESRQREDLLAALRLYAPLFEKYRMTGLVEPLGFAICSVRFKRQAVDAIRETGLSDRYRIVHDTFHHYLSGEGELFPRETGLIHTSGVHPGKDREDITDDDRLLVDESDVMDNAGQIRALYGGGFDGILAFEPFSPAVQSLKPEELEDGIRRSLDLLLD